MNLTGWRYEPAHMTRVYVTGMGVVSSIGLGRTDFWSALTAGRSGVSPVSGFDTSRLDRTNAAQVKSFRAEDHLTANEVRHVGRCSAFSIAAARMAVRDANLTDNHLQNDRTAVVLGTTMGEADIGALLDDTWISQGRDAVNRADIARFSPSFMPIHVARALGSKGMVLTLPAACAAGNYAIGFASDLIRLGRADVVITGASEMLQELQYCGFLRLGALAPERCQPFDVNRQGLIVGEGSGVMVLESEAHAVRRGAHVLAEVGGYGVSCDAYHITRPHPDGAGSVKAMRSAIARSGLTPADVNYVNAHGTGTRANDTVETIVMREVFGNRRVAISSIKSMIGHTMGASSAIEAIACVETVVTGIYPPNIHYETPDPECDLDVVANTARRGASDVVLNNALAFGGYDAIACFARPGRLPPPGDRGGLT
jgi:3-oxoacyl-[acyl-carrier-protein] synthase II